MVVIIDKILISLLAVYGYNCYLFQVILSIGLAWAVCAGLTAGGIFPDDPEAMGYAARTDTKISVLTDAKWFRFPYPRKFKEPRSYAFLSLSTLVTFQWHSHMKKYL